MRIKAAPSLIAIIAGVSIGLFIRYLTIPGSLGSFPEQAHQYITFFLFLLLGSWFIYRGVEAILKKKFVFYPTGDFGYVRAAYNALFGKNIPL